MAKNIVILADGTGQRGGLLVDERCSNVYKIFRAVRCGPESSVRAQEQLAYYDPGLGTLPGGINSVAGLARTYFNTASKATGLGIQKNIEDCYEALLRLWQPGDRIYLFGFSRGAYTVRCLAGVLSLCGLVTTNPDGSNLTYTSRNLRKIAKDAVRRVYGYTPSRPVEEATDRQKELLAHRRELAMQFREAHGSDHGGAANVVPHFIGVFDTVASLMNPASLIAMTVLSFLILAVLSGLVAWWSAWAFLNVFGVITLGTTTVTCLWLLVSKFRATRSLGWRSFLKTIHLNPVRVQMYDKGLDTRVVCARHAISIDEARRSFPRVKWGKPGVWVRHKHHWFKQLWFAGNHSDIGGGYSENESRLSDIALAWMVTEAAEVGLRFDSSVLHCNPDPLGPQHDETKAGIFRFARKKVRRIKRDAELHPSVLERMTAEGVLQYDRITPYRPSNLERHDDTAVFY